MPRRKPCRDGSVAPAEAELPTKNKRPRRVRKTDLGPGLPSRQTSDMRVNEIIARELRKIPNAG